MEQKDSKVEIKQQQQQQQQQQGINLTSDMIVEDYKNVRFQIREFEWFEAESKIRNYVCELMQPTLRRFAQEQKQIDNLNSELQNTNSKLQELSDLIHNTEQKIPIFEKIKDQFYEIELKFEQTQLDVKYTVEKLKSEFNTLQNEQNIQIQQMEKVHQSKQQIEQKHASAVLDIQQYKNNISEIIKNMNIELLNQGQILRKQVQVIDKKLEEHDNQFQEKQLSIDSLLMQLSELKNQQFDFNQQLNQFNIKLGKSDSEINILKGNIQLAKKSITKMDSITIKLQEIENFIDKYLPLFNYSQISEILYQCINNKNRSKLVNFEETHLEGFNQVILSDNGMGNLGVKIKQSQQIIEKIMIRNKNFKNQLEENQPASIQFSDDKKSSKSIIQEHQENINKHQQEEYQQNKVHLQNDSQSNCGSNDKLLSRGKISQEQIQSELFKITQLNVEKQNQYIINKTKDLIQEVKNELYQKINLLQQQADENHQQFDLGIQKEHAHIEQLAETMKNLNNEQILEKGNLEQKINAAYQELERIVIAFNKLSDTLYKLLHFNTLQHHLSIQDELDKQGIALFGFKDTYSEKEQQHDQSFQDGSIRISSQNDQYSQTQKTFFSNSNNPIHTTITPKKKQPIIKLDTQCLSCNGQAAVVTNAFKMACLVYQPSNIILGGKTYKRDELLKISSKILTTAKQQYGIKNSNPIQTDVQQQLQQLQQQQQELSNKPLEQTLNDMSYMLSGNNQKVLNKKYPTLTQNLDIARKRVQVQRKLFSQNDKRSFMPYNVSYVQENNKNIQTQNNLDTSLPIL